MPVEYNKICIKSTYMNQIHKCDLYQNHWKLGITFNNTVVKLSFSMKTLVDKYACVYLEKLLRKMKQ